VQASSLPGEGIVGEPETLGSRLKLRSSVDMTSIGEAVHGFLAADRPGLSPKARGELAADLLERWRVQDALEAPDLLHASDGLSQWVGRRWPSAKWRREWPVAYRMSSGTIVRGFADLVLELDHGFVLIDHKSFPGGLEVAQEKAASFAGQLGAYAHAIAEATAKPLLESFIHLPLLGLALPVEIVD